MGSEDEVKFLDGKVILRPGDCRDVLRSIPDNSIDSVVTDPPYALVSIVKRFGKAGAAPAKADGMGGAYTRLGGGFMGKQWDTGETAFAVEFWAEVLRVLKPGGHVVAFSGTRTYHRMACAIEDAGFEIRDQIGWAYGCLDDCTQAVTPCGLSHHSELKAGDTILTYDSARKTYQWGTVEHVHRYQISDTMYRITTPHGEQVVSRNHRCLIERGGEETFEFAEDAARQREARVPVLENLPALLVALRGHDQGAGNAQSNMLEGVQECADWIEGSRAAVSPQSARDCGMWDLRKGKDDTASVAAQGPNPGLLARMQRRIARGGMGQARAQGPGSVATGVGGGASRAVHWAVQSLLEGWRHIRSISRELCWPEVCEVSAEVSGDVTAGRLRHGTPLGRREHSWAPSDASRVGSSHRSQSTKQLSDQSHVVLDEQGSQAVRAWPGHRSVVVRITPEHYDGVIWCVTVRTGAFVAVRDGMAFPTGNSGFPKSHDVSKGIDKAAGVERQKIAVGAPVKRMIPGADQNISGSWVKDDGRTYQPGREIPATDAAKQWDGWGTALKPSWEPICVARKPLIGTVAENVIKHGTGALNIDGCRIEADARPLRELDAKPTDGNVYAGRTGAGGLGKGLDGGSKAAGTTDLGRWPANLCHDGSPEVLACFPDSPGQQGDVKGTEPSGTTDNTYGKYASRAPGKARRDGEASADRRYTENGGTDFAALPGMRRSDGASAARFFYTSKADADDRLGSKHPTVKPLDLMQWLVRLVTPKRVLACPNCEAATHAKNSTEKASSNTPVCVVPSGLQTEGQSTHGQVLQPTMCGGKQGLETETVRLVRNNIPASEGWGAAMLQSVVCGEVDGKVQEEHQGLCDQQQGLSSLMDAGSSAIPFTEGLRLRASVGHAAANRPPLNKRRGRASQKRRQDRQSTGEFGVDGEGGSRQAQSAEAKHAVLSSLPWQDHNQPACAHCGHRLEWRPGVCLDPFAGTGTTGEAAWREGMRAILIEREPEYQEDIKRRMELATQPTKRAAVAASKNNLDNPNDLPLFAKEND